MILNTKQQLTAAVMALLLFAGTRVYAQQAQTPSPSVNTISYQGSIVEMDGSAVKDSIYPITVSIWTDATQGTRLWRDVFQTEVKGGIFNILLGSQIPLPSPASMDKPLWLNVSFNTDLENLPRFALGTVPSAMNVADSAITSAKIANGAVQSASIADSAVTSVKLAAGAVQSANLADSAVTGAKMATDYVSAVTINGTQVTSRGGVLNLASGDGVQFSFDSSSNSVYANVPLAPIENLPASNWGEEGNYQIAVPAQFIGTTDSSSAMEIHLEDASLGSATTDIERIAHYQFETESPNITMGYGSGAIDGNLVGNAWTSTSFGSTIAGGGAYEATNSIDGDFDFIGSGVGHQILFSNYAMIGGGYYNSIFGDHSAIAGGMENQAETKYDFIGGGFFNVTGLEQDDSFIVIGGGRHNYAEEEYSGILGGDTNQIYSPYGFIGGGMDNIILTEDASTSDARFSSIVGGTFNSVGGRYDFIGGGSLNNIFTYQLDSLFSVIVGGKSNSIRGNSIEYSFIGGGYYNAIDANYASMTGGDTNIIDNDFGSIGGGRFNQIYGIYGTIAGGDSNSINIFESRSQYDAIGGGLINSITSSDSSDIAGGAHNSIFDAASSGIGGGTSNQVEASSDHSYIGGGETNIIYPLAHHGGISAGLGNYIDSSAIFSYIGGGRANYIEGPWCVIGGGDSNSIRALQADHNVIGGGLDNIEDNPSFGFIGSGWHNYMGFSSWASAIGSGDSNTCLCQIGFIGSGRYNKIDNEGTYGSGIASGDTNYVNASVSFLGGGQANQILGNYSAIGGGEDNIITLPADHATIPGGDSLIANSYAQTVIGYDNLESIALAKAGTTTGAVIDLPLFIVGNGQSASKRSNAFEVSYDGHSTVYGERGGDGAYTNPPIIGQGGNCSTGGPPAIPGPPITGATYQDNVIYAWGDVAPDPTGVGGHTDATDHNQVNVLSEFGVNRVERLGLGQYQVWLDLQKPDAGGPTVFQNGQAVPSCSLNNGILTIDDAQYLAASVNVTLIYDGWSELSDGCPGDISCNIAIPNATRITVDPTTHLMTFEVIIFTPSCDFTDRSFVFQVVGRP